MIKYALRFRTDWSPLPFSFSTLVHVEGADAPAFEKFLEACPKYGHHEIWALTDIDLEIFCKYFYTVSKYGDSVSLWPMDPHDAEGIYLANLDTWWRVK